MNRSKTKRAFTIVELLVVISIIALLLGLLLPAMASVRANARATKSRSNLRQWGIGTISYTTLHDDKLPWPGLKEAPQVGFNMNRREWWANAIPPLLDQRPYREIAEDALAHSVNVPMPADGDGDNIFLDPSAEAPVDAPWAISGDMRKFYFNYVPNSQLDNSYTSKIVGFSNMTSVNKIKRGIMNLSHIKSSERTILMLEMRSVPHELPPSDPFRNKVLNRHRSDWKRFASRHFDGGHLMFADGHVDWALNEDVTTNAQGTRDPNEPEGDWNTQNYIWDPMGPAYDED